ncbi:uncharacterized protein [Lepeophtheirus salmonis]|uniref:uncharacterized protein n=1 Tax=Lepeophtheirus salmonis TaxID=72036 RepID=UPI001AEA7067|nr:uncharacterized protein LOC121129334 [Lepeophtheirus salmonis]
MEHLKNDMGFISGPKYCDGTCYSKNVRFNAKKILTLNNVKSPVTCQSYCKREIQCKGFNYVQSTNICMLVKEGPKQYDSEVISGIKTCKAKEKNVFVNLKDCYDYGVDYKEGDIMQVNGIIAPWECQLECQKVQRCNHWTYKKKCLLKTDHKGLTYTLNKNTVSGPKYCFEYKQDVDIKGGHFRTFREIKSAMICQKECDKNPRCLLFSYHPPKLECHLKTNGTLTYRKNFVASSKTVYNKNITTAISPIIQTVVRTPNCFSYGLKFETSGSAVEIKKMVNSVELCHKYCKYRVDGCDYFVYFRQRRKCFILGGELRRARPCSDQDDCVAGPSDCKDCFEHGLKKAGREYQTHSKIHSPKHCQVICREGELCVSWNYDLSTKTCHLYQTVDERIGFIGKNYVFGLKECGKLNSAYKPLVSTEKRYLTVVCFLEHVNYSGDDIDRIERVFSAQECQKVCQAHAKCIFWSWNYESQICYRKNGNDLRHLRGKQNYISGPRVCENCFRKGVNLESKDIETINKTSSPRDCQIHCQKLRDCKLWVLIGRVCYLRTERISHIHIETDAVSGTPECSFVLDYHNSISGEECISDNILYEGSNLISIEVGDYLECELSCIQNPFCTFWTFNKQKLVCTISKDRRATNFHKNSFVSGEINCQKGCSEFNVNYIGTNIDTVTKVYNPEFCQYLCQIHIECSHWTYIPFSKTCVRKMPDFHRSYKRDYRTLYISGPKFCGLRTLMEHNNVSCINIGYSYEKNNKTEAENPEKCSIQCKRILECNSWTFEYPKNCYLSTNSSIVLKDEGKISGPKHCQDCFVRDVAYLPLLNKTIDHALSPYDCQRFCINETGCKVFTFIPQNKTCYLSNDTSRSFMEKGAISGPSQCVYSSTKNKISEISPDFIRNRQNEHDIIRFKTPESQLYEVKNKGNEFYQRNKWNVQEHGITNFSSSNKSNQHKVGKISHQTDLNYEKRNNTSVDANFVPKNISVEMDSSIESFQLPRKKKVFYDKKINLTNFRVVKHGKTSNLNDSKIINLKESKNSSIKDQSTRHVVKYKKIQYYVPIKKKLQKAQVKLNVEPTLMGVDNKTLDSRDSKAIPEEKKSDESSDKITESLLNEFNLKDDTEILLVDENGKVENITGGDQINDWDNACLIVGIEIDVPNHDIYSSLTNPFECAVFCKLHSECYSWTFKFGKKVCQIKGIFTSFDVKEEKDSVSGIASCDLI